jgi:hypothetical protein
MRRKNLALRRWRIFHTEIPERRTTVLPLAAREMEMDFFQARFYFAEGSSDDAFPTDRQIEKPDRRGAIIDKYRRGSKSS